MIEDEPKRDPLEKTIQDGIIAYLVAAGFLIWRNNQGAMFAEHKGVQRMVKFSTMPGISDLQAVKFGKAIFIEVKRPKKKLSDDQKIFQSAIRAHGGIAFRAESIEDVYTELSPWFVNMLTPEDYYNQLASQKVMKRRKKAKA